MTFNKIVLMSHPAFLHPEITDILTHINEKLLLCSSNVNLLISISRQNQIHSQNHTHKIYTST